MYIKEILIQNFKGFEKEEFKFDSKFNVAIGNNATGKSTLLQAVQVVLGGYLQCLDIPGTKSNRRQFKPNESFVKWDSTKKDYVKNNKPTLISTEVLFSISPNPIKWTRLKGDGNGNSTSHNKKDTGELMSIVDKLINLKSENPRNIIPIVASFGTERTVAQLRKGNKAQIRRSRMEKAFLAALSEKVDFDGVIEWLHNYDKELKYDKEFKGTRDAVYNAIQQAIPYLKNIEYNRLELQFEAEIEIDSNAIGKTLHSNMSDGLKAMLNLVAELAFRCVILNGFLEEKAVLETEGVVLIDELDMHLHPTWQRHVVDDLKKAFPKIQFIVTTHSPYIVQSIGQHELINLESGNLDLNPKDLPINKIATDIMGVIKINSDDFEERHEDALETLERLALQNGEINQTDYSKLKQIIDGILLTDAADPVYRAYLEVKNSHSL
jgi:predicted ATP-binding protein involved in virulence